MFRIVKYKVPDNANGVSLDPPPGLAWDIVKYDLQVVGGVVWAVVLWKVKESE